MALIRLLLVEDCPADADLMLRELTRHGLTLEWERVDDEAAFLAALKKKPDLILSDFSLPKFDAGRVLELVAAQKLDIPVIIVSGEISEDTALEYLKKGAADYLLKDRLVRLGAAVEHALSEKTALAAKRAAEETQARMAERLHMSEKLESIGLLSSGLAHDFNNLLVGIRCNATLALRALPADSPIRPLVDDINRAGIRATELTNQMLAYAGHGRFTIGLMDINQLIRETANLVRAAIPKTVELRFELADALPKVDGDAIQVRQVLMNLLINAGEAIDGKAGVITVASRAVEAGVGFFRNAEINQDQPPGRYVGLSVADTGCGMSPETKQRIFTPLFTTKVTGRGLGLVSVLGTIRSHNGAVKVISELGQGTRFEVWLPASKTPAPVASAPAPEPARAPDTRRRGSGTILVVDDEEMVRRVAARMLSHSGFEVLAAEDGEEGLRQLAQHAALVRGVLLDMTMPRLGGVEAFAAMRRQYPAIPIVVMTGYDEAEARQRFPATAQPTGVVPKPFDYDNLLGILFKALEDGAA